MGMLWEAISFEVRIAPLVDYYKKYGSLENIISSTKYVYNGKEENVGKLINTLRIQYRLRTASEETKRKANHVPLKDEEVRMLENIGILWDVSSFEARIAPFSS